MKTFTEHLQSLSAPWLLGTLSERWAGLVLGFVHDAIAEAVTAGYRMALVRDPNVTKDSLPHIARNFNLPAYPIETAAQHVTRMTGAWELWQNAGHDSSIESQLATLGVPGTVYGPSEWSRGGGYWSRFWLLFAEGDHPVTGQGPICGSAGNAGSGLTCGPVGLSRELALTIRRIVGEWKPVDWICDSIIFVISGPICGADGDAGGGEVCGGETVAISA